MYNKATREKEDKLEISRKDNNVKKTEALL